MDFGETLLAAQRNQQQKNSGNMYYRSKYEPPKKEQKPASRLSANIQKFLMKKEEEERRKQEDARRKRDELLAMRDPKATKKIQKMLKVIKSANKSVLEEATDREHTAITRSGADQPDQDDYGYESQEAAALYSKMMEKYSKIPEEEKFPAPRGKVSKKDLEGTRERMRAALQREEDSVNQPRQRKTKAQMQAEREDSPPAAEKKVEKERPKVRRPMPPPIDFSQLLKLAEQKKDELPEAAVPQKRAAETEPERLMTKRQRKEFEEEQARKERREQRKLMETQSRSQSGKEQEVKKQERPRSELEKKSEFTFNRIPKIGDKHVAASKSSRPSSEPTKKPLSEETRKSDREKYLSGIKQDVPRSEQKKSIELKSQNTYRIDRNSINKPGMKFNRENDTGRTSREEEQTNRQEYTFKMGMGGNERERHQKQEERSKMREDIKAKVCRQEDRGRFNRPEERGKIQKEFERGKSNKEDDRGRISKPEGKVKTAREQNRQFNDQRVNIGKQTSINSQNKSFKNSEQLRKPEVKEKIVAKERMLFGNEVGNPKLNGVSKDKYPRQRDDAKSKDRPVNLLSTAHVKPPLSNNKMKPSTSKIENKSFDFDKHVNSLKKGPERPLSGAQTKTTGMGRQFPPADVRRKLPQGDARGKQIISKRPVVHSDSEYDSEMDDFIDDGDDDANYSAVIKEVFGYDRSKYRDYDEDDRTMESSFAQQMREEYISKKIGIMEDLEDMRMEAMEKKKSKKRRCISDDEDD